MQHVIHAAQPSRIASSRGPGTAGAPGGGFRLSNRAEAAKILPAATGTIGRPLDAYRAAAIPVSGRALP